MEKKKVKNLKKGDIVESTEHGKVTIYERRDGKGRKGKTEFQILIHDRDDKKMIPWTLGFGDDEVNFIEDEGEGGADERARKMLLG